MYDIYDAFDWSLALTNRRQLTTYLIVEFKCVLQYNGLCCKLKILFDSFIKRYPL